MKYFLFLCLLFNIHQVHAESTFLTSANERTIYNKDGSEFIKTIVSEENTNNLTVRFYHCSGEEGQLANCNAIGDDLGHSLSKLQGSDFFNSPQPNYIDYKTMSSTKKGAAFGTLFGATGLFIGAVVTIPAGFITGGIIGAINDTKRYFSRASLIKDLVQGSQYHINDISYLTIAIEDELLSLR